MIPSHINVSLFLTFSLPLSLESMQTYLWMRNKKKKVRKLSLQLCPENINPGKPFNFFPSLCSDHQNKTKSWLSNAYRTKQITSLNLKLRYFICILTKKAHSFLPQRNLHSSIFFKHKPSQIIFCFPCLKESEVFFFLLNPTTRK